MRSTDDTWITDQETTLLPLDKWQNLVSLTARLFAGSGAYIVQSTTQGYRTVQGCFDNEPDLDDSVTPSEVNIFCKKLVESEKFLYVPDASLSDEWADNPEYTEEGMTSYLGWPIRWPDGKIFGSLCVFDSESTDYSQDFIDMLESLAQLIEGDLQLLSQNQTLRELANTDESTGLHNRRGFELLLEQQRSLNRRYQFSYLLFYLDIDNMKAINDEHGHQAGDRAIMAIAEACQQALRNSDIAARLGGDEFALACVVSRASEIDRVVARVYDVFSTVSITADEASVPVQVSIGHIYDQNDTDIAHLLALADKKMYAEKNAKQSR